VGTVAEFVLQRLVDWGVDRIYGYPGDGINGFFGALRENVEIESVQVRHEEMAAFMPAAMRNGRASLAFSMSSRWLGWGRKRTAGVLARGVRVGAGGGAVG
jgi:thiamine pyrophosphate-dependent acetolactate synthase large subunit-like protein